MLKRLGFSFLFILWASSAFAQGNPQCPTRPTGDNTNACASTAFVQNGLAGTISAVNNIAALRVITNPTIRPNVEVNGYYAPTDGGGGLFYWNSSSTTTDNGGTVIQLNSGGTGRYIRQTFGEPLSVKWFGATGDGLTDDTVTIRQTLVTGTGASVYFPATSASYLVTDDLSYFTNTIIYGDGAGSVIKSSSITKSILTGSNVDRVTIRDLKLFYTTASSQTYVAAINCVTCTNLTIINNEVLNTIHSGILLRNTTGSFADNNYIHGNIGTGDGTADIAVYDNSSYNTVSNNKAWGGATAWHGIIIQDTTGSSNPNNNKVLTNYVKTHGAYGIINYNQSTAIANDNTLIDGNTVEDILGSIVSGGLQQFGMCIYVVETGGAKVTNNKVSNCNAQTVQDTLAPAAISVTQDNVSLTPNTVSGNSVVTSHKWGVNVSGNEPIVVNNTVELSSPALGGINVVANNSAGVRGNTVKIPTTLAVSGIQVQPTAAIPTSTLVDVSNNIISGGNASGVLVFSGAGTSVQGAVTGNQIGSSGAAFVGLAIQNMLNCTIANNNVTQSITALSFANNTNCTGTGNSLIGTTGFTSGGTNTGNFFDASNTFGATSKMNNAVTGVTWAINVASIPTAGAWQVGDQATNTAPTLNGVKGWINTTAGSPGTWSPTTITVNGQACNLTGSCTVTAVPSGSAGGDLTGTYPNPTLVGVITAGGPIGSATVTPIITYDAKGRLITVSSATITPAVGSITGLGTGVATALGVNVGTAGSFVVNGGALGSPSSAGTLPAHTLGGTITAGGNNIDNTGRLGVGYTTSSGGLFGRFYTLEAGVSSTGASGFEINAATGSSANLDMGVNAARTFAITTGATGTQITQFGAVAMSFAINGGTNALVMTNTGSVVLGSAAVATTATDGFLYVVTSAGQPTGVPTSQTGRAPLIYDTTNHQFWIYDSGWKQPKTPAGAATITWQ